MTTYNAAKTAVKLTSLLPNLNFSPPYTRDLLWRNGWEAPLTRRNQTIEQWINILFDKQQPFHNQHSSHYARPRDIEREPSARQAPRATGNALQNKAYSKKSRGIVYQSNRKSLMFLVLCALLCFGIKLVKTPYTAPSPVSEKRENRLKRLLQTSKYQNNN